MVADSQTFILHASQGWKTCLDVLMSLRDKGGKYQVDIKPYERTRSIPQNARYWASLTQYLKEIDATIKLISEQTGYTVLEIKQLIGRELPLEQAVILFAKSPEIAHDVLKEIHGIPTSTRLGTKEFMQYEERMEQTIAEIVGVISDFAEKAK